jgi:polysaccharide deacetylase 2 family uncharacterized protein YibQ
MAARRRRRRPPHWLAPLGLGALLGAGLVIGVLLAAHVRPGPPSPRTARPPAPPAARPGGPAAPRAAPIPRRNPGISQGPAVGPGPGTAPAPHGQGRARVAIIFDDAGYSLRAAREVMALGRPVTISILPSLPYSTQIAEEAAAHGVQVILHLPLEPDNAALPVGPGGVTVDMSDRSIRSTVAADLATVPTAVGANNHMGSRGTSDPRVMRDVIGVMKARRLFFVDSLTSPHSVAARVAREMGVPTGTRAVFLDNQDEEGYVRAQLQELIGIAQARGRAIAIGHVGKVTARVLREMLPEFDEAGIQLVFVSQLVQ